MRTSPSGRGSIRFCASGGGARNISAPRVRRCRTLPPSSRRAAWRAGTVLEARRGRGATCDDLTRRLRSWSDLELEADPEDADVPAVAAGAMKELEIRLPAQPRGEASLVEGLEEGLRSGLKRAQAGLLDMEAPHAEPYRVVIAPGQAVVGDPPSEVPIGVVAARLGERGPEEDVEPGAALLVPGVRVDVLVVHQGHTGVAREVAGVGFAGDLREDACLVPEPEVGHASVTAVDPEDMADPQASDGEHAGSRRGG